MRVERDVQGKKALDGTDVRAVKTAYKYLRLDAATQRKPVRCVERERGHETQTVGTTRSFGTSVIWHLGHLLLVKL